MQLTATSKQIITSQPIKKWKPTDITTYIQGTNFIGVIRSREILLGAREARQRHSSTVGKP
jgi:hypothetical protein